MWVLGVDALVSYFCLFFFQAEDGIRDHCVTGVQTCALPICSGLYRISGPRFLSGEPVAFSAPQIGIPAGGRELDWVRRRSEERRVGKSVDLGGRRTIKKKKTEE